ncbi:hypothetical protein L198_04062 [Cryptococcus wingfieldii CBS 7118]|uniref:Reverse transcriptase domain-containing protein n=1 Tax=Cryptococcus wingfieldii CBS 7118 TaxID=1295528 RepID=A0A1E3I5Q6_9TREE|nr:hypothetical protein L198_07659 [Cryptococcus wingfieldii CBS 7118]XP_019032097.1 hypothetical protein L198_04062 [Cryptococcus wingfieldii CBS 7118]ODN83960.1 hypothetical protein L198_07659 [Cryptococcus wingfieldii CBS 7118]ODN97495.1 hypothetical protein L198_04062 [Cryptococcus wingfieldii CBS 7118]
MAPATRSGPPPAPAHSGAATTDSSLTSLTDSVEAGGLSQAQSQAGPSLIPADQLSQVSHLGDPDVPQSSPNEDEATPSPLSPPAQPPIPASPPLAIPSTTANANAPMALPVNQSAQTEIEDHQPPPASTPQATSGSRAADHPTQLPARATSLAPSDTPSSWHSDLQILSQNQALLTRLLHSMHEQNVVRPQSIPASSTPPANDPTLQTSFERRRRLRPADLSKFGGSDTEDVDTWLEKLTAALEHADYPESELLTNLPFLLEGKALDWFTDLGSVRRDYQTWDEWRVVFKNAFRIPDFEGVMRRKCIARRLLPFESFADYFDAKRRLQRWVYPEGTSSKDLITDMVEGIPLAMRALIKASTPPGSSLDDFRCIMLDLQPSLRSQFPSPSTKPSRPQNGGQPQRPPTDQGRQFQQPRTGPPPSACKACGEWHWREFCPLNNQRSANGSSPGFYGRQNNGQNEHQRQDGMGRNFVGSGSNGISRPSNNRYPDHQQGMRPAQSHSQGNGNFNRAPQHPRASLNVVTAHPSTSADAGSVSSGNHRAADVLPEGTPHNAETTAPSDVLDLVAEPFEHVDKTLTYAYGRFGTDKEGSALHRVIIDSGASITVLNADYADQHLAAYARHPLPANFQLSGMASLASAFYIHASMQFVDTDGQDITLEANFFLAKTESANIILGNDVLLPLGARIDLDLLLLSFRDMRGAIPITASIKEFPSQTSDEPTPVSSSTDPAPYPAFRLKNPAIVYPGHRHRAEVVVGELPPTDAYLLEPLHLGEYLHVARSVGSAASPAHFVMIIDSGKKPIVLGTHRKLGRPTPAISAKALPQANAVNHTDQTPRPWESDDPSMEDDQFPLRDIQLNPELSPDQRKAFEKVILYNKDAFGYGSRPIGSTTLATMSIPTGDAPPVSSPPYRASPQGREIIDTAMAELLEHGIIQESESPWASPAIIVQQKGKSRFCIDYRKVNSFTTPDQYPLPTVDEILSQFAGMKYFSTFDANRGFHQIPLDDDARAKSAFRTHQGLHE